MIVREIRPFDNNLAERDFLRTMRTTISKLSHPADRIMRRLLSYPI